MNRFETIDFDRLREQGLRATLLNERPLAATGSHRQAADSIFNRLARTFQTFASLWNRSQRPLPEHFGRSRDRMLDATRL